MAFLQSSGAISLSQVQAVMGGANPISLSEYYRGGAYVPSTKTVIVREPTSGEYYTPNVSFWKYQLFSGSHQWWLYWGGGILSTGYGDQGPSSLTVGGYTYFKGTFYNIGAYNGLEYHWGIYRTSSSTVSINGNVPTSGTISLSNFYGAEKP